MKFQNLKVWLGLFLWSISVGVIAQDIQGCVLDSEKYPLEGVTILNHSDHHHSHSDAKGYFVVDAAMGDTLEFFHIGFDKTKVVIRSDAKLEIILHESTVELDQVTILPALNSLQKIQMVDLKVNPVNSSQDLLRKVPGLFIGQHAGGGKAEQIFLRGFDIDHGTDVAITVDGLPVNMVSHAHGQGYADLHFVIPETIEAIDFSKGPYQTKYGNFATAGQIDFQTKETLDESMLKLEGGMFNTRRLVGMLNVLDGDATKAYVATEYLLTDGPFDSPQDFSRVNFFGKLHHHVNNQYLTLQASTFTSGWNASGQIPQRAIDQGLIGRFGAIDDTEGGGTSRSNLSIRLKSIIDAQSFMESMVYLSKYDFNLYSNFTFFLDDPINGDQILQHESRAIYGIKSYYSRNLIHDATDLNLEVGVSMRMDEIVGNELSHTKNRIITLDTLALGNIRETNSVVYADLKWKSHQWLVNAGLRYDEFRFSLEDFLSPNYKNRGTTIGILSPKLNLVYNPQRDWQLYVKSGKGFHSNDTRVILANTSSHILPAAWGTDLGTIFRPFRMLYINAAFWYLYLQQEFVYVGDAGVVEPSGESVRKGFDLGVNFQVTDHIYFDMAINTADPIAKNELEGQNYIPLAPTLTSVGGLTFTGKALNAGVRYRYMGDRPANEDNSVIAKGYFVADANASYDWKRLTVGVAIQNLLNTDWNETQFDTESRLQNEVNPVSEIHFTPGTPFFLKVTTAVRF